MTTENQKQEVKEVKETTHTEKSPNEERKYAVLQEFNDEEKECWLFFIKYNGNEKALKYLAEQLEKVEFEVLDGYSTFDLEIEHLVCEKTAKEMTDVDLNHYSFHRKFDGKMKMIDLNLKSDWKTSKKIRKVCDILGYGSIEEYVSDEDVDPSLLVERSSSSDEESGSGSGSSSGSDEEEEDEESSEESEEEKQEKGKKKGKVPPVLQNKDIPGFARAKMKKHNRHDGRDKPKKEEEEEEEPKKEHKHKHKER